MKRANRRAKTLRAIKKQLRIAKLHGLASAVAGKFRKRHAMDCGNPRCYICGNPRKIWKMIPIKEQTTKEDTATDFGTEQA